MAELSNGEDIVETFISQSFRIVYLKLDFQGSLVSLGSFEGLNRLGMVGKFEIRVPHVVPTLRNFLIPDILIVVEFEGVLEDRQTLVVLPTHVQSQSLIVVVLGLISTLDGVIEFLLGLLTFLA